MIDAREAYKKTSEAYDSIAKEKFEEFKKEADKAIDKAISLGRWSCYIPCDDRARGLAYQWLTNYGYQTEAGVEGIYANWRDAGSSPRGE